MLWGLKDRWMDSSTVDKLVKTARIKRNDQLQQYYIQAKQGKFILEKIFNIKARNVWPKHG